MGFLAQIRSKKHLNTLRQIKLVIIMRNFRFSVVIEKDDDGYFAFCPEMQGCYTQGATYEEVLKNIRDAMKLHIEDRLASGEDIAQPKMTSLAQIEVAV